MIVLNFRDVDGRPGAVLIVEDIDRLGMRLAEIAPLMELLEPESSRRLRREWMRRHAFPTYQTDMSRRIKRGIQAAKERRQAGQ